MSTKAIRIHQYPTDNLHDREQLLTDEQRTAKSRGEFTKNTRTIKDVDLYIVRAPEETRIKLEQLRKIVRSAVPEAEEVISYKMPYYKYHGPLVGFAAFKDHIGLFGALTREDRVEFKDFEIGRGTIRLPLDKPLPEALITKLVIARKKRNELKVVG